jgi:hypothetical protein
MDTNSRRLKTRQLVGAQPGQIGHGIIGQKLK